MVECGDCGSRKTIWVEWRTDPQQEGREEIEVCSNCESQNLIDDYGDVLPPVDMEDDGMRYNFDDKRLQGIVNGGQRLLPITDVKKNTYDGLKKGDDFQSGATVGIDPNQEDKKGGIVSYWKNAPKTSGSKGCPIHEGDKVVFRFKGRELCGAEGGKIPLSSDAKVVIDCAGVYSGRVAGKGFVEAPRHYEDALQKFCGPEIIRLHWPDFTAPKVDFKFWRAMWRVLPKGRIIMCCMGGHGRTGTALASMIIAANTGIGATEAIKLVREKHCSHAVENTAQSEYLHNLVDQRIEFKKPVRQRHIACGECGKLKGSH